MQIKLIEKTIEFLATWFRKQLEKGNYFVIPLICIIGIFVCIYEEINV